MRIISADDHPLILEGIASLLQSAGHTMVAGCSSGRELLRLVEQHRPNAVTLDVAMPELNGFDTARQLQAAHPLIRIVFITQQTNQFYIREAFLAGGSGFVAKQSVSAELVTALSAVVRGRRYVTPSLVESQGGLDLALQNINQGRRTDLTPRQREVLQLIAEGRTAKEIAARLNISVKTVEFHKQSLTRMLDLHTTAELTRFAVAQGLVTA